MKLQKSTPAKRGHKTYCVLRGRVAVDIKDRVAKFCEKADLTEAQVVRQAVREFLSQRAG